LSTGAVTATGARGVGVRDAAGEGWVRYGSCAATRRRPRLRSASPAAAEHGRKPNTVRRHGGLESSRLPTGTAPSWLRPLALACTRGPRRGLARS
jgi:hypothetical protein